MKNKRFWLWFLLSVLWLAVIFMQSAKTATVSSTESRGILAVLQNIFPCLTHHLLRKLAHFFAFALLGVLFTNTYRHTRNFLLLKPLSSGLFAALCDETLQLFVEGRSGQISDVWLDFSGVVCGTLLVLLICRLRKK